MSNKTEYYSEEEESQCPLCLEEMDLSDRNFRPCPCGYQVSFFYKFKCFLQELSYITATKEFNILVKEVFKKIKLNIS
jgi:hypothetical protein